MQQSNGSDKKISDLKAETLKQLPKESVEDLARALAENQANQTVGDAGQGPSAEQSKEETDAKWKRLLDQVAAMKKLQYGLLKTVETIPDRAVRDILYGEAARELADILKTEKKPDRLAPKTEEDEDSELKVEAGSESKEENSDEVLPKVEEVKTEPEGEKVKKEVRLKGGAKKSWTRPASQRSISSYFQKGKNFSKCS